MSDRGWYRKYEVTRLGDYANKHLDCEYFVLDLDHDEHAPAALRAYAASCAATHPQLAKDLEKVPLRAIDIEELAVVVEGMNYGMHRMLCALMRARLARWPDDDLAIKLGRLLNNQELY